MLKPRYQSMFPFFMENLNLLVATPKGKQCSDIFATYGVFFWNIFNGSFSLNFSPLEVTMSDSEGSNYSGSGSDAGSVGSRRSRRSVASNHSVRSRSASRSRSGSRSPSRSPSRSRSRSRSHSRSRSRYILHWLLA